MDKIEEIKEIEEIEFDCPVCNDNKKHKAKVIRKFEDNYRAFMEVQCMDCGRRGTIKKIKTINMELYEF